MAAPRLFRTTSADEQWRAVAFSWLETQGRATWKDPRPTVMLTPSRAEGFYLRSRLVSQGKSFLGIRFWTPSDARKFLLADFLPDIHGATLADLRLLARTCAERRGRDEAIPNHSVSSVVRDPAAFLRAHDMLVGAGWDPARDGSIYGRELAQDFQEEMLARGVHTQPGLHRRLLHEATTDSKTLLGHLLVIGFNAAHWPLWDLLKAVTQCAEQATVSLLEPREFAADNDQLWIGSWEEFARSGGVIAGAAEASASTFANLVASYEKGSNESAAQCDVSFCVTSDLTSHVRAVVLHALGYLKEESCSRLGIVFAEASALALGVTAELRRLKIPLNDGTGLLTPGAFENRSWQSWLALQAEPGAATLIAWVRACEAQGRSCGAEGLTAAETAALIDGALGETLVDDLDFLAAHLRAHISDKRRQAVADFLSRRVALPSAATFGRFLVRTRLAMELDGWDDQREWLQSAVPARLSDVGSMMSRRTFLEWLREAGNSQTRVRDGNHFYGRVHLLVYGQMTGQTWSHLILTGLNEGVWPRLDEAGAFGSKHELDLLNRQSRMMNRRASAQGSQGEGHDAVREGFGHCLVPIERQDLALRDLCAAVEGTSEALCLSATTAEGGRGMLPSDFFSHAYQAKTGRILDETIFRALATATESWCASHRSLLEPEASSPDVEVSATAVAYAARRDETRSFGPYEFAFAEPPLAPIQLRCKQWDEAWIQPAIGWLQHIVGVAPWPDGALSWPRAVGTWVHRWLAVALKECRDRGECADFPARVDAVSLREMQRGRDRARVVAVELYPWWDQVVTRARTLARLLADTLAPQLQGRQFFAEMKLPEGLYMAPPGQDVADFELRGRIDLLLVGVGPPGRDPTPNDLTGYDCWVVDFKTGTASSLTEKILAKGAGLQPLLYGLAIQKLGASHTAMSLVTPAGSFEAQLQIGDGTKFTPLFQSLDKLHREGIFGMRPQPDSEFGYAPEYPIATRFVPNEVLEAKWARLHGGVISDREDAS